jgi:hypothetical protein
MEVEDYKKVCFSHQLLVPNVTFILKFWYFILPKLSSQPRGMHGKPYKDQRLKIVLNRIENARAILVSIVYNFPTYIILPCNFPTNILERPPFC